MRAGLQRVSTADLYYICQMIDNVTRSPGDYLRHIEDFFGDSNSLSLVRNFPKWTCFHEFIEAVISSVIWEQASSRVEVEVEEKGLWIDRLIDANDGDLDRDDWEDVANFRGSVEAYLSFLTEIGVVGQVCELLSKQVFHVLFADRRTLRAFGNMVAHYVSDTAHSFSPESFTSRGHLKRKPAKSWAKNAVFHRDKGRCVFCRSDLTKTLGNHTKIHYDHIIPLAKGGLNCVTNLQTCCEECNLRKGAKHDNTSTLYEPWFV